jgi:hypothetical protein
MLKATKGLDDAPAGIFAFAVMLEFTTDPSH